MTNRMLRDAGAACAVVFLLACGAVTGVHAQVQDNTLDRIQNLMATGRFTEARNTLERWERDHGDPRSSAGPGDRARALYLRGVLSSDAKEAEDAFLGVVLSYPSSSAAPDALLRLGQALLTAGEARRAAAYLERLRSDYPGAAARETGLLWLARAQLAAGMASAACSTARDGIADASAPHLRTLMELEQDRACGAAPVPLAQQSVPPPVAPRAPQPQQAPPTQQGRPAIQQAVTGEFAVQTGAYRELGSAENIARQMRSRGFDVRVVLIGDSPLYRVRFGAFDSSDEAHAASARIRAAGFAVIVVNDVQSERR
jgi:cell division septation protein DedD